MMPMTRILSRELRGEFDGIATEGGTGEDEASPLGPNPQTTEQPAGRAASAPPEPL